MLVCLTFGCFGSMFSNFEVCGMEMGDGINLATNGAWKTRQQKDQNVRNACFTLLLFRC